jgi:hypothetical protein
MYMEYLTLDFAQPIITNMKKVDMILGILNLKALCFGAITDIMMELIVYWGVPQSRQS